MVGKNNASFSSFVVPADETMLTPSTSTSTTVKANACVTGLPHAGAKSLVSVSLFEEGREESATYRWKLFL